MTRQYLVVLYKLQTVTSCMSIFIVFMIVLIIDRPGIPINMFISILDTKYSLQPKNFTILIFLDVLHFSSQNVNLEMTLLAVD